MSFTHSSCEPSIDELPVEGTRGGAADRGAEEDGPADEQAAEHPPPGAGEGARAAA